MVAASLGKSHKNQQDHLAALCTLELGNPSKKSAGSVQYAIDFMDWLEAAVERALGEKIPTLWCNHRILTIRQPQGVIAAITLWNSPLAMVIQKVGAAIAAGNIIVCKPAPETPLCALALAKLFEWAGGPQGVFNVIPSAHLKSASNYATTSLWSILASDSTAVGKYLNSECARTTKKTSLELNINVPF